MEYEIIERNRCTINGGWLIDRIGNIICMRHVSDEIDEQPIILNVYDTAAIANKEFQRIADDFDSKYERERTI